MYLKLKTNNQNPKPYAAICIVWIWFPGQRSNNLCPLFERTLTESKSLEDWSSLLKMWSMLAEV